MCEDRNCDCNHHPGHPGRYHRHHMKGYKSLVKRTGKDVIVPEVLLEVADVDVGDFLEISIRSVKKHHHHDK
ncbi:hypothetical protein [Methanobacterium sp.]|jgi:hypothetical protein|uniref:hypothetical protein n=1 Tax=Methanobacterium sp. TaxID=2164 RepID=UPI0031590FC0